MSRWNTAIEGCWRSITLNHYAIKEISCSERRETGINSDGPEGWWKLRYKENGPERSGGMEGECTMHVLFLSINMRPILLARFMPKQLRSSSIHIRTAEASSCTKWMQEEHMTHQLPIRQTWRHSDSNLHHVTAGLSNCRSKIFPFPRLW